MNRADYVEDDVELTPLEYARLHLIAIDHKSQLLPQLKITDFQVVGPSDIIKDGLLTTIEVPVPVNTIERLTVDRIGAILLAETNGTSSTAIDLVLKTLLDSRVASKLHVELPLLKTDHDIDTREFASWDKPHYRDGTIPHEPLDAELDQTLDWPQKLKSMPGDINTSLKNERLVVEQDSTLLFYNSVFRHWTDDEEAMMWETSVSYSRNSVLDPVSPPLLPSSPILESYIPSSPGCHLPLLSDPPSLVSEDRRAAEESLFAGDILELLPRQGNESQSPNMDMVERCIQPSKIFPASVYIKSDEDLPISPGIKLASFKVEVPITPHKPMSSLSSPSKSVTFNEVVEEMLLDDDYYSAAELSDSFFSDAMAVADVANRRTEQEQLQEADSTTRVDVPKMDFRLPDPPWKYSQKINRKTRALPVAKELILHITQGEFGGWPTWPRPNISISKLVWFPFPVALSKVAQSDTLGEEHDLDSFLFDNTLVTDSSSLIWKPPGLRILVMNEDDDSEDELELGDFVENQPHDISSLVRKRRLQYEEERSVSTYDNPTLSKPEERNQAIDQISKEYQSSSLQILPPSDVKSTMDVMKSFKPPTREGSQDISNRSTSYLLGDGTFSASSALDNYLEIRASKKQKPTKNAYFSGSEIKRLSQQDKMTTETEDYLGQEPVPNPLEILKTPQNALIAPELDAPQGRLQTIISSTLLNHRTLIRTMESFLPNFNMIERDFSAHNSTAWQRGSVSRSPVVSPLASEADLIISPSTGIILTTLTQIRQKPLPGQKTKVAIQARIERVSFRYESLVVIVSEGSKAIVEATYGLDDQSAVVIAEFAGFCASLETPTICHFATGGEANLAKWIAGVITQAAKRGPSWTFPLMQEETLWELFLRRAGMNAFAAQVVLVKLKAPEGVDETSPRKVGTFGLTAFVEMGDEERVRRFGRLLGGTRTLKRVGLLFETKW